MSTKERLTLIAILGFLIGLFISFNSKEEEMLSPIPEGVSAYNATAGQAKTTTLTPSPAYSIQKRGKVSYYTFAGCLGCNPSRITASGDVLDDNKLTLAIPAEWRKDIPMGTMVEVENLDNGKSVIAKVNDTGGFLKYDRIADLSLATCEAIECKTDQSTITITIYD